VCKPRGHDGEEATTKLSLKASKVLEHVTAAHQASYVNIKHSVVRKTCNLDQLLLLNSSLHVRACNRNMQRNYITSTSPTPAISVPHSETPCPCPSSLNSQGISFSSPPGLPHKLLFRHAQLTPLPAWSPLIGVSLIGVSLIGVCCRFQRA
jgi:hypothetical protein